MNWYWIRMELMLKVLPHSAGMGLFTGVHCWCLTRLELQPKASLYSRSLWNLWGWRLGWATTVLHKVGAEAEAMARLRAEVWFLTSVYLVVLN